MTQGRYAFIKLRGIGLVGVARTPKGICRVEFMKSRRAFLSLLPKRVEWCEKRGAFGALERQLKLFAAGKRTALKVPLDLGVGTPFQRRVWRKIASIPWGRTRSYAQLARAVGKPKAFRAVANACGANPAPLVVPCHRIVASDGTLGGFSSGVGLKKKLLNLEGVKLS